VAIATAIAMAAVASLSAAPTLACSLGTTPIGHVVRSSPTIVIASVGTANWDQRQGVEHYELAVERVVRGNAGSDLAFAANHLSDCNMTEMRQGDRALIAIGKPMRSQQHVPMQWVTYWRIAADGTVANGYDDVSLFSPRVHTLDELLAAIREALPATDATPGQPAAAGAAHEPAPLLASLWLGVLLASAAWLGRYWRRRIGT
jgi:hypothetical protein